MSLQDRKRPEDREWGDGLRKVGMYTAIPAMMLVGPVLGWLGGSWLEGRWGHEPWPSVAGAVLGMVAAFRQVYLVFKRAEPGPPGGPGRR